MTPKEDQQPMTTREELVAEFERAWRERPWRCKDESAKDIAFSWWEAGRLASRQEVSVTVEGIEKFIKDKAYPTFDDWGDDFARALLANYVITKRTTEG
jgi:hypothetical protein